MLIISNKKYLKLVMSISHLNNNNYRIIQTYKIKILIRCLDRYQALEANPKAYRTIKISYSIRSLKKNQIKI